MNSSRRGPPTPSGPSFDAPGRMKNMEAKRPMKMAARNESRISMGICVSLHYTIFLKDSEFFGRRGQPSPLGYGRPFAEARCYRVFVEAITVAGAAGIQPATPGFGEL